MALLGGCGTGLSASASAQAPPETVHWTVATTPAAGVQPGGELALEIQGQIQDGWHVYGLKQLPDGPTPLRVKLDANDTATAAGEASETPPQTLHDVRFGLDTQFHTHAVTVHLPVRIAADAAGRRQIPVSVRFQLCSESECQPPRTVHLAATIDVGTHG